MVVKGIVVQLDAPYLAPTSVGWERWLVGAAVSILLLPVLIAVGVVAIVARFAWRFSFGGAVELSRQRGFTRELLTDMVGFGLVHRLLGKRTEVPVRDVRIRDSSGTDYLVRVQGHLAAGNFSVADPVAVNGPMQYGTVFFRHGYNYRTRAEIRLT